MIQVLIYFFIAISLSMDAFSLALSIGTVIKNKLERIQLSSMIGTLHFIMPIMGCYFGNLASTNITTKANYISSLIFLILAGEIWFSKEKEDELVTMNPITLLIMSLTVSIDSFSVGIAIGMNKESILQASIIFMIVSSIFTNLGIMLGNKIKNKYNKQSKIIGVSLLLLTSIKYLLVP